MPASTPFTIPVSDPIVATLARLELHTPPDVVSDNVVPEPWHIVDVPVIGPGMALIVTVLKLSFGPQLLMTV